MESRNHPRKASLIHRIQAVRRTGIALALLATCFLAFAQNLVAQSAATEYQIKAAYLLNFGKFINWPPPSSQTRVEDFSICVLGEDPFGSVLDATVRGEKLEGLPVIARRIRNLQDGVACRVLYISRSERGQLRNMASALAKLPVLTVSDIPDFMNQGGVIQFTASGNRIRFEVNLDAAQQAGLGFSSELLKVASAVRGKAMGGGR